MPTGNAEQVPCPFKILSYVLLGFGPSIPSCRGGGGVGPGLGGVPSVQRTHKCRLGETHDFRNPPVAYLHTSTGRKHFAREPKPQNVRVFFLYC